MHALEPYYAWRNHYVASQDPKVRFTTGCTTSLPTTSRSTTISSTRSGMSLEAKRSTRKSCTRITTRDTPSGIHRRVERLPVQRHHALKREVIDPLMAGGVTKFVLIGENVLNFHHSDDAYYEEWFDEVVEDDGWIALLNFREHVLADMQAIDLDSYFVLGGELNELGWRTFTPEQLCRRIDDCVEQRWGLLG